MKMMYCWRCRMDVAMLDEDEYSKAYELYGEGIRSVNHESREAQFEKLLTFYENVTGFKFSEPNAILHHRISQYGPPCEKCKKPYRTPKATFCAACGHRRFNNMIL